VNWIPLGARLPVWPRQDRIEPDCGAVRDGRRRDQRDKRPQHPPSGRSRMTIALELQVDWPAWKHAKLRFDERTTG
jgi:hypothetical protein